MRRGFASILGANAGGQLILLGGTLVIARIYTPAAVGQYSYLLALTLVLAGVAGLRFEWALALPSEESEAVSLWWTYVYTAAIFCAVLAAALGVLELTGSLPQVVPITEAWVLLPVMVLATAIFNGATQLAIRGRTYGAIGLRGLTNAIVTTIAQVGLGLAGLAVRGLVLGFLLGRVISTFTMLGVLGRHILPMAKPASVAQNYRNHWRYPALYAPSSLLNLIGTYAPIAIVINAYGASAAGQLGLAQTLVLAPLGLLGTAAGQVFIGELTASLRSGSPDAGRHYVRASRLLALVALPVFVGLLLLGPTLIPLVLGRRWELAGELGAAIGISACAGLVASPLSYVFVAYGKNLLSFALDASRVLLVVGIGLWMTSTDDTRVQETVLGMSLGQTVNYALTWILGARAAASGGPRRENAL